MNEMPRKTAESDFIQIKKIVLRNQLANEFILHTRLGVRFN